MLEKLLAAHGCEVDYDGACVGCVCGPTYLEMRDGKAPEQDHAWHARHLVRIIESDRQEQAMTERQTELETMPELMALRQRTWKGMVALRMEADTPGQVRVSSDLWKSIGQALTADPACLRVFGLPVRLDGDLPADTVTVDSGGRVA